MLYDDKVLLVTDPHCYSGVNREAFVDQQEWLLYEHVDTEQRFVKEFVFQGGGDDEDDDDANEKIEKSGSAEDRKRSVLTITCHAGSYWDSRIKQKFSFSFSKPVARTTFTGMDIVLFF
jgi:hypothetical protein